MAVTTVAPSDGTIIDIDVSSEMRSSFLEYAYSVIYARALPDARDGLKPVQRRILFQMSQMGLRPDRGHVKSSRVVGDVMGKLHPHGDSAIYDALVRLAQPFNLRLPLVDGHGNFGSLDDGPAAARYTEARLAPAATELVADLDEDVVDFVPNYDNQFLQPEVLPAGIPNLLVNGASGIAVGMATSIAPHNLSEVIAACIHLIRHPDTTLDELMRYVPGPDLPEGGVIVGLDGIREAYECGRGTFKTRAKVNIERVSARKQGIVITQLPYLIGPERVIERLKEGVNQRRIQGVSSVQNLTDRKHGLRLVIEVKNGFNPEAVLSQLYKYTPLEDSFGINAVALVQGQPQTLGLKRLLEVFVDHRLEVVRRRSQFRLTKCQERLHLVEGLLVAVLDIDDVIAIIRSSDDVEVARDRLMTAFDLSLLQADHILALRLRRLTKFSRIELEGERDALAAQIAQLQALLDDKELQKDLVCSELEEVSTKYGTPRRTVLISQEAVVIPTAVTGKKTPGVELEIPDEPCQILLSATGLLARVSGTADNARSEQRAPHDGVKTQINGSTRSPFALVTSDGILHRLDTVMIPQLPATQAPLSLSGGTPAQLLAGLPADLPVVGLAQLNAEALPLLLVTKFGTVKRVKNEPPSQASFWSIITLEPGDEVIYAGEADDNYELIIIASDAQLLRTPAAKIRPQGRAASGMAGIKLQPGSQVIAANTIRNQQLSDYLVVTVAGSAGAIPGTDQGGVKVTQLSLYPQKGRATQGVRAQRFLQGEDQLQIAAIVPTPARASSASGSPIDLPNLDPRRDASGVKISSFIAAIG